MTTDWQGVPWAIGGGALVPAEVARLLAYLAIGGEDGEGVVGPGDCAVLQLPVAAAAVRIMPGAVGVLNRMADAVTGGQQAYLGRMAASDDPEDDPWAVVTIAPTGGSARTDLVAVIVEDPLYAGQSAPASVQTGPYTKTRVYENVGAGVTTLGEVDPGQAGYALARIALPAGTATVTQARITDLRAIPNPRTRQETKLINCADGYDQNLTSGGFVTFPTPASFNIAVPKWAVKVHLELYAAGIRVLNTKANDPDSDADDTGNFVMRARLKLGTIVTDVTEVQPTVPTHGRKDTFTLLAAGEEDVPKALRGTTQTLEAQAYRQSFSAGIEVRAAGGTTAICKATFFESAASDAWEV